MKNMHKKSEKQIPKNQERKSIFIRSENTVILFTVTNKQTKNKTNKQTKNTTNATFDLLFRCAK